MKRIFGPHYKLYLKWKNIINNKLIKRNKIIKKILDKKNDTSRNK